MIRKLIQSLRRLLFADPAKDFLTDWAAEIEQETAARKRRNADA